MAIYKHTFGRAFESIDLGQRLSNQVIISGDNQKMLLPKGVFLLDMLILEDAETVEIKDGLGVSLGTGITSFEQDNCPIILDRGIEFVGSVVMAKGSVINGIFHD